MYRMLVTGLVLASLLAACAPGGAVYPTSEAAPAPPVEEPAGEEPEASPVMEWDGDFERFPAQLCRPDDENAPLFGPTWGYQQTLEDGSTALPGILANPDGEVFGILVYGSKQESVEEFAYNLRICLDFMQADFMDEPAPPEEMGSEPEEVSEPEEGILVEIYLAGYIPEARSNNTEEITRAFAERSFQEWEAVAQALEVAPDMHIDNVYERPFYIDFVIDPWIPAGAVHQFVERRGTKAWVTVTVNAGSVKTALCKNAKRVSWMTVNCCGILRSMANNNAGVMADYDLGVKGNPTGRYRVSGRWGWTGWSLGYFNAPPVGSKVNCNP